jgi:hypothetical protein
MRAMIAANVVGARRLVVAIVLAEFACFAFIATSGNASLQASVTVDLKARLTTQQTAPREHGAPSNAGGLFMATVNPATNTLTWKLSYAHLSGSATQVWVTAGKKFGYGVVAPVCRVNPPCSSPLSGTTSLGTVQLTEQFMNVGRPGANALTVTLYTARNPRGELRGTLRGAQPVSGSRQPTPAGAPRLLGQLGTKLTSRELTGSSNTSSFGSGVALSSDGRTALIGSPGDDFHQNEAVWVLTRSGSAWRQQAKLTGVGADHFGAPVALSADGNTALVGAPGDDDDVGSVFVFTRSGSTWTQQAKLTGTGESGDTPVFGSSLSLSADGNTALIGGPNDHFLGGNQGYLGAAWVFTRSGSRWTQQGGKLTGRGEIGAGGFGGDVALSADGDTALISAPGDNRGRGAAWVFVRSGSKWAQQGGKLTGNGETSQGSFGNAVLAANGATALIGGTISDVKSAEWVFNRSGSTWSPEGVTLVGYGSICALSADGMTDLIGDTSFDNYKGAVFVMRRSGSTWKQWKQEGGKLIGRGESGAGAFGNTLAISGDGTMALIGAPDDGDHAGAVWFIGIKSD